MPLCGWQCRFAVDSTARASGRNAQRRSAKPSGVSFMWRMCVGTLVSIILVRKLSKRANLRSSKRAVGHDHPPSDALKCCVRDGVNIPGPTNPLERKDVRAKRADGFDPPTSSLGSNASLGTKTDRSRLVNRCQQLRLDSQIRCRAWRLVTCYGGGQGTKRDEPLGQPT